VGDPNVLKWDRRPGHYEVYYLTLTDRATGTGVWVRYTLEAPLTGEASCALWLAAMDPERGVIAKKHTLPIAELAAESDPFAISIGSARLTNGACAGAFDDVSWELRWPPGRQYEPVPALLRPLASTVLVLAHGDVAISGRVQIAGRTLELEGARGAQTHLWGTEHAAAWAWARCGDFRNEAGERVEDTFIDAVSARVRRFGRELGPSTLLVGRIGGDDLRSSSLRSRQTTFGPDGWRFARAAGSRKLLCEVTPKRSLLAGVTYHDPDGERAYCYNSEAASMRLEVQERGRKPLVLVGDGRAHFEYGQRQPIPELELHVR
jgi:hypothetical protein